MQALAGPASPGPGPSGTPTESVSSGTYTRWSETTWMAIPSSSYRYDSHPPGRLSVTPRYAALRRATPDRYAALRRSLTRGYTAVHTRHRDPPRSRPRNRGQKYTPRRLPLSTHPAGGSPADLELQTGRAAGPHHRPSRPLRSGRIRGVEPPADGRGRSGTVGAGRWWGPLGVWEARSGGRCGAFRWSLTRGFTRWVRVRGGRGGDREGEGGYGSAAKEWSVGVWGCSVGEVGRGSAIAGLGLGGFSRQ